MKKTILIIILILGILLSFSLGLLYYDYKVNDQVSSIGESTAVLPKVSAEKAILVDDKTGEVLFAKKADEKAFPASTTKIMTALTALEICNEQGVSIKQEVVVPTEAENVEGSSMYLKRGDKITIENLLYGVLLQSGNDGAVTLSATIGGSTENFIRRMNAMAAKIGCKSTNFTNPSGLYDEKHYTTAEDLALISMKAIKNSTFRDIVGTKQWGKYANKNKTLYNYEGATGIKIGFTKKSGRTLVASAERKGEGLICVVLNDGNWFNDAYSLLDYGFRIKGVE